MNDDITNELHGVRYIISRKLADDLKVNSNIDAIAEIETAIAEHYRIISTNTPTGEINGFSNR